jgi:SDR family mycofactocin-dependent oxidoreductase
MKRFAGQSVLITGAARGQGRSHAIAFAREGANVAICDICADIATVPYPLGTAEELAATASLCEAEGVEVLRERVDVRSFAAMQAFTDAALARFGRIDVVVANAGIFSIAPMADQPPEMFDDVIDVCLKGVCKTIRAVLPSMIQREYGRIIATGSYASVAAAPNFAHYGAAKHGIVGLITSLAREVGDKGITANYLVPNGVATPMVRHETMYRLASPDDPTEAAMLPILASNNPIPLPWIQPEDVSKLVLFLASEDARYTTGTAMKIDLGASA